jgi:protein SCO1
MKHLLILAAALLIGSSGRADDPGSICDLGSTWTNQDGSSVSLADLRGKPRVVAMFFSNCSYACPRITADLQSVAAGLTESQRAGVGFVMASFDVERDRPDVLKAFAREKKLPADWQLLHGDEDAIRELAAALGVRYRKEPGGDFAHSNMITVLDAEGRIVFQREGLGGDLADVVKAARDSLGAAP